MSFFARSLPLALVLIAFCAGFAQTPVPPTPTITPTSQHAGQATASQSATAKVEMPSDPVALLELAAKRNGLRKVQSAPWHLKASYQVRNEKGIPTDEGTFEEFWVSNNKSVTRYTSARFNQTSITTDQGVYREGNEGTPRGAASLVRSRLFDGVSALDLSKVKLKLDDRHVGNATFKCISTGGAGTGLLGPMSVQCFDPDLPVLRIIANSDASLQTLYTDIALFEGIYVARNVELWSGQQMILRVHIDTLETYAAKDDPLFAVPAGATLRTVKLVGSGTIFAGNIVHKVAPQYPAYAKQQGIQGAVVLHAVITSDGRIADLEPIVGPAALIRPALDAVRQWQYRPYLVDGVPVELETEIHVIFSLGG